MPKALFWRSSRGATTRMTSTGRRRSYTARRPQRRRAATNCRTNILLPPPGTGGRVHVDGHGADVPPQRTQTSLKPQSRSPDCRAGPVDEVKDVINSHGISQTGRLRRSPDNALPVITGLRKSLAKAVRGLREPRPASGLPSWPADGQETSPPRSFVQLSLSPRPDAAWQPSLPE